MNSATPASFLQELFPALEPDERIEIRVIEERRGGKVLATRWYPSTTALLEDLSRLREFQAPNGHAPGAIYFGIAPRTGGRGTKEAVRRVLVLWADLDSPEASAKLPSFPFAPSALVASGGALHKRHVYWFLRESEHDVELAERTMKGISRWLGGDHVQDRCRILRLPGTLNMKNGKGAWCQVLELHPDRRYSLSDFEAFVCDEPEPESPRVDIEDEISDELPERAALMLEADDDLRAAWEGRRKPPRDHSRSGYDMMLASLLVRAGLEDSEVAAVLRNYRFGRGRESTRDYLERTIGRARAGAVADVQKVEIEDFHAYMPMHNYVYVPVRDVWPAASVNARVAPVVVGKDDNGENITVKAAAWLDQNRPVEQMTWAPGEPMLIEDRLVSEGGWIPHEGCRVFNLYRAPTVEPGDPGKADPWIAHLAKLYPMEGDHIVQWIAHRVQRPQEKINHVLVFGGAQGIGKDTILEPIKRAVGSWNFAEVTPAQLMGRFNGFVKSVILRVNEARDLGDVNRYAFYEHLKPYAAAPPDVLRCDEKHLREYSVSNVCGVLITTNYKTDGIYLPPDDRRHYVAWSEAQREDFQTDYWTELYRWYEAGGYGHVAAFLKSVDLSQFDSKAPPPKTDAFWEIVDANRAPEDAELGMVLELLGNPDAVTLDEIVQRADERFREWLQDRKNNRQIPHRLEAAGYVRIRNPGNRKQGLWTVNGRKQAVYARQELSVRDRIRAAQGLL